MATDLRVLAIPKNLEVGGSQVTAVDLARTLQARGHSVVVGSTPGPLDTRLKESGIEVMALPEKKDRMRRIAAISGLIRSTNPDVVHGYEVRQILDVSYASRLAGGTPILGSIMSTRVPWFLPESTHITVGMPNLAEFTRRWRTGPVSLLQPTILVSNAASTELPGRTALGTIRHLAVLVSRLVLPFKREGILRTISAMSELASHGVGLLIVGDGEARGTYETAARSVNARVGRKVVVFAGEVLDPSVALAQADIVVGNGVPVMTGVAHSKPSVVVGREGFSVVVGLASLDALVASGFYGVAEGLTQPDPLPDQILAALADRRSDDRLAARDYVLARYGVENVAGELERFLIEAASSDRPSLDELVRTPLRFLHYRYRRARLRVQARSLGLEHEQADNHVYGRLRDMALPPSELGTGRNRRSESEFADDSPA